MQLIIVCIFLSILVEPLEATNFSMKALSESLSKSNNEFALDILKSTEGEKNQLFSPFSITSALLMLSLGAKGNSLSQLLNALHLDEVHLQSTYQCFAELTANLTDTHDIYDLSVGNKLFIEQSYKILEKFLTDTTKYFGASTQSVDFRKSQESASIINKWVSDQTKGKISNIIDPDNIDGTSKLVLANAIYFKGKWKSKFKAALTREENFHVSQSKINKVQMMHLEKTRFGYAYNEELNLEALELPYMGDYISMVVLLPHSENSSMDEIGNKLTVDILKSLNFMERDTNVYLPRFKLGTNYLFINNLQKLGVTDMFTSAKADLSGIGGTKDIYVSNVLHKAFIEVNEEGSEAAAATVIEVSTRSGPIVVNFIVNRPFLFYIKEKTSGTILFLGKVVEL